MTYTDPNGSLSTGTDLLSIGNGGFAALTQNITDGASGAYKANKYYRGQRTLAAAANDDLDLSGGLSDPFGNAFNFTYVRGILLAIVTPDGTKKLRFGPQNVANAWQGPFGGVGATVYFDVLDHFLLVNFTGVNGWAVTAATADILRINNPSAGAVTYNIAILGQG